MSDTYSCWADHGEDLTAKVEVELASNPEGGGVVFLARRPVDALRKAASRGKRRSRRKVMVTCSEGHENVFEIDG